MTKVVRLGQEGHVVLAQLAGLELVVDLRFAVPEGQVALAARQVGGEDALVVFQAFSE